MARDYKHRVQQNASYAKNRRRQQRKQPVMWWRWLLVAVLVGAFVVFLNMMRNMVPELLAGKSESEQAKPQPDEKVKQELTIKPKVATATPAPAAAETEQQAAITPTPKPVEPEEPRYDFYTILPQTETVVPDYEIKSRVREELVGKTKVAKYVMQAGSFHEVAEAERHKAKLALLGIESRIEKAKINNAIWYRIKIGPYDNPSSVATIKDLLQKNGIGVVVTETGQQ